MSVDCPTFYRGLPSGASRALPEQGCLVACADASGYGRLYSNITDLQTQTAYVTSGSQLSSLSPSSFLHRHLIVFYRIVKSILRPKNISEISQSAFIAQRRTWRQMAIVYTRLCLYVNKRWASAEQCCDWPERLISRRQMLT